MMLQLKTKNRDGFSIPEMLAVIAIIVIVISILLPAIGKSKEATCKVICQTKLHSLHQAFVAQRADTKMGSSEKMKSAFGWQKKLLPYANDEQSTAVCCAHDGEINGDLNQTLSSVYLEVFSGTSHLYNMDLVEGIWTLRIDQNSSDADLARPNPDIDHSIRNEMADNVYRFYFEDLRPNGGDQDFHDVVLEITELEGGDTQVEYIEDAAGYTFNLRSSDGTLIWENMDRNGQTKPGSTTAFSNSVASYGMNREVETMSSQLGENVIFMLDYNRSVAEGGTKTIDPWNEWTNELGVPDFARHDRKANVMFISGAVSLMDTADIDPAVTLNRNDLWLSN